MSQKDLEQRVATLEEKVSLLKQLLQHSSKHKDWQKTFGMFADDPGFEEMVNRGREYRESQQEADS
ncbi:MAG: hypothetical protein IID46_03210 [Planctomycetes bacterium]|nr:hypothetical protein [Planctomycetota bacterium]